jgi:hypothetical protein
VRLFSLDSIHQLILSGANQMKKQVDLYNFGSKQEPGAVSPAFIYTSKKLPDQTASSAGAAPGGDKENTG